MINRIAEPLVDTIAESTSKNRQSADPPQHDFSTSIENWMEKAEKLVTSNPGAALAAAAAVGILLGWWVKRR